MPWSSVDPDMYREAHQLFYIHYVGVCGMTQVDSRDQLLVHHN